MSELGDQLWSKGFMPNVGEPWTLEDHERVKKLREAITEAIALIDDPDIPSVSKATVARERLAREIDNG